MATLSVFSFSYRPYIFDLTDTKELLGLQFGVSTIGIIATINDEDEKIGTATYMNVGIWSIVGYHFGFGVNYHTPVSGKEIELTDGVNLYEYEAPSFIESYIELLTKKFSGFSFGAKIGRMFEGGPPSYGGALSISYDLD